MLYQFFLEKFRHYTLQEIVAKSKDKVKRSLIYKICFIKDMFILTYSFIKLDLKVVFMENLVYPIRVPITLNLVSNLYIAHYFDLLGSGWVNVKHGRQCLGLEGYKYTYLGDKHESNFINKANRSESERIKKIIDKNYIPIDWQLDFKSGYRWSEKTWYMDIKYGHKPGVDIKVPWELARMQHLTMLAWAYGANLEDQDKEKYAREFRNQVLDFIANNPPRFGVNWRCTMDVGIRVVNWLVAYDLSKALGAKFDVDFEQVFARSVYEHGKHCYENLEYHPKCRNNHYLSDIAGLLFASAHLERNSETDVWLAFAVQELISEMNFEFNPDGSNFEASTCYHRLSTEIMLYCAVLCLALPNEKKLALKHYDINFHSVRPKLKSICEQEYNLDDPWLFPAWFWERLEKACEFTMHILKPNGEAPQIGDNDSGRFLKIWPSYTKRTVAEAVNMYKNLAGYSELPPDADYWDENILDHRHILAVGGVLFNRQDFLSYIADDNPEAALVRVWLKGKSVPSYWPKNNLAVPAAQGRTKKDLPDETVDTWLEKLKQQFGQPVAYIFELEDKTKKTTDGLETYAYPDFGLYIYKSPCIYLAVRCGDIGQNGLGGHAHNDQLSIELTIEGKDIICDPGTYLYTPLPEKRNEFRATRVHFTPCDGGKEQNSWIDGMRGLFRLSDNAKAEVKYFAYDGFVGMHIGFGRPVYRLIRIKQEAVYCYDFNVSQENKLKYTKRLYSRGYGICEEKRF